MGIKIGYLTDLHLRRETPGTSDIAARHCREMADRLPRALAALCAAAPDLVVCTGDVLDVPAGPGVAQDLEYCRQVFAGCRAPWVVLPGNHDPFPDEFYRVFPRPAEEMTVNDCQLLFFPDDACAPGALASRRSEGSLRALAALLGQPDRRPAMTLLWQHYVIYPDLNAGYPHNYQNDAEIRSILERATGPRVCVSGHYHPGFPLTEKNGVAYFIGRAFCEAPHPFYLIDASARGTKIEELTLGKAGP